MAIMNLISCIFSNKTISLAVVYKSCLQQKLAALCLGMSFKRTLSLLYTVVTIEMFP